MSHTPSHASTHIPAPGNPFSAEERGALVTEDLSAAKGLAFLMNGVFVIGVILYSYVAWSIFR